MGQESQSLKDSAVVDSSMVVGKENDCSSENVCPVGPSPMEINDERHTSNITSEDKFHTDVERAQLCQNPDATSISVTDTDVTNEEDIYVEPNIGMEFRSEEHAYKCYNNYAVLKGFSIRKDFINKSRVDGSVVSRRFTCHRQGFRSNKDYKNPKNIQQETRTGCLAHMTISRQSNSKFRVTSFEIEHNHEFVTPSDAHMLPSHKKLSFAQALDVNINESTLDGVPKLGMGFDSEEHAYEFYNTYAAQKRLAATRVEDNIVAGSSALPKPASASNCRTVEGFNDLDYDPVDCEYQLPFKFLDYRNIRIVPSKYILKRWTKDARV
ncbi:hypothetical protein P8452_50579 [Trifolium repens]|nr:hypothetical protein P8452_50575 [Trifolium repens]WJX65977.1 hypothetical protein P8452_50579 [Trifolium repens]